MPQAFKKAIILVALISQKIYFLRGTRIILDADLAKLYGVTTSNLNLAVQRNRGGRRYAPYAFTEQGVAMLSSVLRSQRAVQVNVAMMRWKSATTRGPFSRRFARCWKRQFQ
jgi:hypothetical protein